MTHRRVLPVAALSLLALAGCSTAVVTTRPPAEPPATGAEEVGYASWYGSQHQGKRTASGEMYDMNQLTAAHRTLPFGTRVLVTNRDTSQSAEVRVNDRGPFVKDRILDVSFAAARQLGAVGAGIFPVRLRVIALPGTRADRPAGDGGFTVQVGAFTSRARAEALRDTVGGDAVITESIVAGETLYGVRVGSFPDRTQATSTARSLATRGFQPSSSPADPQKRVERYDRGSPSSEGPEREGRGVAGARGGLSPGPWLLRESEATPSHLVARSRARHPVASQRVPGRSRPAPPPHHVLAPRT